MTDARRAIEAAAQVADAAGAALNSAGRRAYKDGAFTVASNCRERELTAAGIAAAIRALPDAPAEAEEPCPKR